MTTKRIETIDIMKGLGIIMVMLGHQDLPVSHLIYSFHMPLFFIIGGYLYKEKSVSLSLKNDFRRLVIPYVFASSLIIGNEMLMSVAKNDSKYVYEALIASIYGSGHSYHGALFSEIPSIGAIWFLMALFWTKNIFNILNTFLNNKCLFITCIVLSFAASYIDKYVINMPFDILPGLSAIIFYYTSNPQPIGFSGILLAKRQNSFYCTYFLHNRNVADTKSPYPIKRLEVIRWFNQKSMVFNQSLS